MNLPCLIALTAGMLWSASAAADSAPQHLVGNSTNLLQSPPVDEAGPLLDDPTEPPPIHDTPLGTVPAAPKPVLAPEPKPAAKGEEAHVIADSVDLQTDKDESYTPQPIRTSKQDGNALTLEQAQAIALEHYPQIVAAEAATRAAGQRVNVERSYYLPQVTGNAIRAFAGQDTRISAPGGLNNPLVLDRGSAGIGVSQLITDFGHTTDLVESSKLELEAQKAKGNLTKETVLLDATRAYFNLLRAQELLKVAKTTVKARKAFLEQVTSLRNAKLKSDLDLSIANQVVAEADLLLLKAKSGVDDAQATLSEALGYSEPRSFTLAEDKNITSPPANLETLVDQAMERNPELASLKAQAQAARKRAEAEQEAQYPTVSALGYAGTTPISETSQPISSHSLAGGINISIPFYTGGRLTAQEREAADQADIAEQNTLTLKSQLLRDIRIAFGNVQTSWQNISVTKELIRNADKALDLTQERYKIGSSSIVDLSQAQLAQTQAQIEGANATYEYLINRALLNYKTGSGLMARAQEER